MCLDPRKLYPSSNAQLLAHRLQVGGGRARCLRPKAAPSQVQLARSRWPRHGPAPGVPAAGRKAEAVQASTLERLAEPSGEAPVSCSQTGPELGRGVQSVDSLPAAGSPAISLWLAELSPACSADSRSSAPVHYTSGESAGRVIPRSPRAADLPEARVSPAEEILAVSARRLLKNWTRIRR